MGLRFHRRLQIVPGVRLNLGARGASVSFGHRGAWLTVGPRGRRRATLGFPGTGVYYTQSVGRSDAKPSSGAPRTAPKAAPSALRTLGIILLVIFFAPVAVGLVAALLGR